ncbi:MAG: class I adenylate-forming enzyme family protein [Paracoccaceae bacterium]
MQLTQSVHKAVRERPEDVATIFEGQHTTHAAFADRVARIAAVLRQKGIQPGDRIAILAEGSDRYVQILFAIWWAGGVINPVNARWSVAEIAYSLRDSETTILFVDSAFAEVAAELRLETPSLETVIHMDAGADGDNLDQLLQQATPVVDAMRRNDDLAAIMYTGGTTGFPKGVMLSHRALVAGAMSTLASAPHPGDLPSLHVAPFFHIGGLAAIVQYALRAAPQVIIAAFDEPTALRLIEECKIADIFVVPTMLRRLLDHPDRSSRDCSSLRSVRYGAAPIDSALLADAMEAFPDAGFYHLYGQTENSPMISILPPADHTTDPDVPRMRSAGRSIVGCEVRIVDGGGQEVPVGYVGQIAVRGPMMMDGYWNKPDETAKAIVDGWLMTGDAGRMDENGNLYILDRVKDMIISGGENIYSTEVENALSTFPGVVLCAVIGKPDPEWGEAVHAVIQTVDGADLDRDALTAHCRERIAGYKRPRSYEFVSAMPLSPAGKILKRDLREAMERA